MADVTAHLVNNSIYRAQDEYRKARADGLQPEMVSVGAVEQARRATDITGVPFRADKPNNGLPVIGGE